MDEIPEYKKNNKRQDDGLLYVPFIMEEGIGFYLH